MKKKKVNSSRPSNLVIQVMHDVKFNKFLIPYIIFHLIDLYDNIEHANFFCMKLFFKTYKKTMIGAQD